jgi:hypothetical protein
MAKLVAYRGANVPEKRNIDAGFWSRADAHITLSNEQCARAAVGEVRASMLYATSRFNAFVVASQAPSAEALEAGKAHAIDYFTEEFRKMLEDNFEDNIKNFDAYFKLTKGGNA